MTITEEQIAQLARIYNTLLLVETKGDSTVTMANCLNALKPIVTSLIDTTDNGGQE